MEIVFGGQYTREDVFQGLAKIHRPSRRGAAIRIIGALLVAALFLAASYTQMVNGQRPFSGLRYLLLLPVMEYFVLKAYIDPWLTARKLWKHPKMHQQFAGQVTGQGFQYSLGENYPWMRFARIRQSDTLLALQTDEGLYTLLPRSFFQSDKDWQAVNTLARANVLEAQ